MDTEHTRSTNRKQNASFLQGVSNMHFSFKTNYATLAVGTRIIVLHRNTWERILSSNVRIILANETTYLSYVQRLSGHLG